jgi:hypothetical protein
MATVLDLCNLSLLRLGQSTITDLTAEDSVSKVCNLNHQQAIDWVLRERAWKFNTSRVDLTVPGLTPAFGWNFSYPLPLDHLRTLEVRTSSLKDYQENHTLYAQEISAILTDTDSGVRLKYLRRVDASLIPSHVLDVIVLNLALRITIPITGSKPLHETLTSEYATYLSQAAALDGLQGRNTVIRSSVLTRARVAGVVF